MKITDTLKKRVNLLLPKDYRKQIVARLKKRNIIVHPNTVSNVLKGADNELILSELLLLAKEEKQRRKSLKKRVKTLAQQL
jgi:hypothetical protein